MCIFFRDRGERGSKPVISADGTATEDGDVPVKIKQEPEDGEQFSLYGVLRRHCTISRRCS